MQEEEEGAQCKPAPLLLLLGCHKEVTMGLLATAPLPLPPFFAFVRKRGGPLYLLRGGAQNAILLGI